MATIMDVPYEIILTILENVSIKDILNFSSTCNKFQGIINDNRLWKKKFSQRWPSAKASYNDKMGTEFSHANFEDVQRGVKCASKMWHYVSRMSAKYFYCNDRYKNDNIFKKDIDDLLLCPDEPSHPLNFDFLFDELVRSIYTQSSRETNLTEKYYAIQIFQCLNRHMLKSKYIDFEDTPKQQRRLEDIIVMVLQWYHPDKYITYSSVDKFIDEAVKKVLKYLKEINPNHLIFLISSEKFSFWKNNTINENHWSGIAARQIKCILDKVILNFVSNELDYPWLKLNQIDTNVYHYTLRERKLHYKHMLCLTMYICVARRLGIHFEISAHFPHHSPLDIHLVWKPSNCTESNECFTIDWMYDQFNLKSSGIRKCQLVPYATKMIPKLIMKVLIEILGYYFMWPIDCCPYQRIMSPAMRYYDVSICTPPNENFCKRRSLVLKYAIGLIVIHTHEDRYYGHTRDSAGVIIGWHSNCQIERFRCPHVCCVPEYFKKKYNQKCSIHNWESQPHYVLLTDNDLCYVPQYAIKSVCTTKINNVEIGKYFCGFEGTHYIPNKELARHYPDDAAAVHQILYNINYNILRVNVAKRDRTPLNGAHYKIYVECSLFSLFEKKRNNQREG